MARKRITLELDWELHLWLKGEAKARGQLVTPYIRLLLAEHRSRAAAEYKSQA